jgi:putative transposase
LLKANSSKWMGEQGSNFAWQEGYGAFSVSSSNLGQVMRYIQSQEAHHRKFRRVAHGLGCWLGFGLSFSGA